MQTNILKFQDCLYWSCIIWYCSYQAWFTVCMYATIPDCEKYPCEDDNNHENRDEICDESELPKELSNLLKSYTYVYETLEQHIFESQGSSFVIDQRWRPLDDKYFFPSFLDYIHSNYLQLCPLWSKIAFSRATEDFETKRYDKLGCRTIKSRADTNTQAEEFFWIKKCTTFRNVPRAGLTEFIRNNNEDNIGMMRQFSDGLLMELEKVKDRSEISSMAKVASQRKFKGWEGLWWWRNLLPQLEEEWKDKKWQQIKPNERGREANIRSHQMCLFSLVLHYQQRREGSAPRSKNAS